MEIDLFGVLEFSGRIWMQQLFLTMLFYRGHSNENNVACHRFFQWTKNIFVTFFLSPPSDGD